MAESLPIPNEDHKKELLELISEAKSLIGSKRFDAIRIATVLKRKITECNINEVPLAIAKYKNWVASTFYGKPPNEYHDTIINTRYPFILTSNYDLLFEEAANSSGFKNLTERT